LSNPHTHERAHCHHDHNGDNPEHLNDLGDCWKLVYHRSFYELGNSPRVIYLPSFEVMFKMMRSCILVHEPKDLWFNYDPNKEDRTITPASMLNSDLF
jgi:hypothetical protein